MPARSTLPPLWSDAAVVTGLWAMGGVQPLLELLGHNPTFFVAAHASDARIVGFLLVVLFAVPAAATVVLAASRRLPTPAPQLVRVTVLAAGAALVGLSIGRRIAGDSTIGHLVIAAATVAFVLAADLRWPHVVEAMRYIAVATVVFGGLFLLSPAGALIGQADAAVVEDVAIGDPADLVVIILDELPTASLLDGDGNIAEDRFPNFARLARSSTWFRNAVSDFTYTTESVPAILSGQIGESPPPPTSANYPENLFTLLGDQYAISAREELSSLCPPDLCAPVEGTLGQMLSDTWVVFRHQTLPERWRDGLPPVDQGWSRFENAADTKADPLDEPFDAWVQRQDRVTSRTAYRTEPLETLADQLSRPPGSQPELHVVHAVLPHLPWEREPGGALYTTSAESDVPVDTSGVWLDHESAVTTSFQRHLLQIGHVDRLVGEVMDAMVESGRWEDTMFVVVADHGVTFETGTHRRRPSTSTLDEVFRVPLFVRIPAGARGEVNDEMVHNGDVVPTVVDALEIDTDWRFGGQSLLDPGTGPARTTVYSRSGPRELDPSLDALIAVVDRNDDRLAEGYDWSSVAAPGEAGALVGTAIADLDVGPVLGTVTVAALEELERIDQTSGFLPVMVEARFEGEQPPEQLLVAIDGIILGAGLPQLTPAEYTTILDPAALTDGSHRVDVLAWRDGAVHSVTLDRSARLSVDDGVLLVDGSVPPPLGAPDVELQIEKANRVDGQIAVWGWSVDRQKERVPDVVVLLGDSGVIAADTDFTRSSDAADRHGDDVGFSRFSVRGPDTGDLRVAAVYPDGVITTSL